MTSQGMAREGVPVFKINVGLSYKCRKLLFCRCCFYSASAQRQDRRRHKAMGYDQHCLSVSIGLYIQLKLRSVSK